jgi:uncharacterized protein YciI
MPFMFLVVHHPRPEHRAELIAGMTEVARQLAAAPGFIDAGPWQEDPGDRVVGIARWQTREAFRAAAPPGMGDPGDAIHPWETRPREVFHLHQAAAPPEQPGSYFLYTLTRPRPAFPADATDGELATMHTHVDYWRGLLDRGVVAAFGPVSGLGDAGGIAIVAAEDEQAVRELASNDPAVVSGLTTYRICAMPGALAPRLARSGQDVP